MPKKPRVKDEAADQNIEAGGNSTHIQTLQVRSYFYMLRDGRSGADQYGDCCRSLSRLSKRNCKYCNPAAASARWNLGVRQAPLVLASIMGLPSILPSKTETFLGILRYGFQIIFFTGYTV